MAVTEEVVDSPLEIAAFNVNTKAFDLLAPRYEEGTKKQISQLLIWALTEESPSAAFMSLFESVPLAEVNFKLLTNWSQRGGQVNSHAILGFNLLQHLAFQGKTTHLGFLLDRG